MNNLITEVNEVKGKANIALDATKLDLFSLCEARYNYRYNMNKSLPIISKSKNLDYGTLAHEGLEVYYTQLSNEVPFNDRMHSTLMKVREVSSDPDKSNADPEEVRLIERTLEQNLDYWRFEDETLEILAVETPFDYVLFEDDYIRIIMSGKVDLLVNKPQIGGSAGYDRLPFDHKTQSRQSQYYRLDNQFLNYSRATGSNYLIVNVIGLQSHDSKNPMKAEDKFKRVPLSFDPEIIKQWEKNVIDLTIINYLNCVSEDVWPMRLKSCRAFNRLCEYYEVCDSSGIEAKLFKLDSNYVEAKPWDKYKKGE